MTTVEAGRRAMTAAGIPWRYEDFRSRNEARVGRAYYSATRGGESPGMIFEAATVNAAKAHATRRLEAGAIQGQSIQLVEIELATDGGWMRTDRVWRKAAHSGKWQAFGDAQPA